MNANQFNIELGQLTNRAMNEGVMKGTLDATQLVGLIEMQKAEVIRHLQDMARIAAAAKQPVIHLPGTNGRLPQLPGK